MDERPEQIAQHIEQQRDTLGRNLDELEQKIKGTVDWRVQFDRHPMAMMGAALGGGLLLGTLVAGAFTEDDEDEDYSPSRPAYSSTSLTRPNYDKNYTESFYPSRSSSKPATSSNSYSEPEEPSAFKQKAYETMDSLKNALLGYATVQAKNWMDQILPGIAEHFEGGSATRSNFSSGYSSSNRHTMGQSAASSDSYRSDSARSGGEYSGGSSATDYSRDRGTGNSSTARESGGATAAGSTPHTSSTYSNESSNKY